MFQKYVYYTEVNAPYLGFGQPYDEDDIGGITIEYRSIGATRSTPGYALTDWNGDYVIGSANIYTGKPLVYAQEDAQNTLISASVSYTNLTLPTTPYV